MDIYVAPNSLSDLAVPGLPVYSKARAAFGWVYVTPMQYRVMYEDGQGSSELTAGDHELVVYRNSKVVPQALLVLPSLHPSLCPDPSVDHVMDAAEEFGTPRTVQPRERAPETLPKSWRWLPGARWIAKRPAPLEDVSGRIPDGWNPDAMPYPGAMPDLTDPATIGVGVENARVHTGDPYGGLSYDGTWAWYGSDGVVAPRGNTRADVVLAVLRRPGR